MGLPASEQLKLTKKFLIMKKQHFAFSILALVCFFTASAQQDPQYTQYMYNMNVMNPAYAGSREALSVGALYRTQWNSLDGAPETFTFAAHSPVSENIGLGISAISDEIGPVKEQNLFADISYTLKLAGDHRLAFGVKGGLTFQKIGLLDLDIVQAGDEAFSSNVNDTYGNVGAGIYYYTNKYFLALSVPNLLNSKHLDVNGRTYGSEVSHYFLTGGYVFDLSATTKFKPSFMLKSAFDAPASLDVNANFLFFDRFEIGASYRLDDSFSGLVNFAITPSLRVGYAYDHIISDLGDVAPASHEVFLQFDIPFGKKAYRSPRYF